MGLSSINEAILQQFNPNAEVHMLRSVDSVSEEDGMHHAYPAEFLQQLNAGGLLYSVSRLALQLSY